MVTKPEVSHKADASHKEAPSHKVAADTDVAVSEPKPPEPPVPTPAEMKGDLEAQMVKQHKTIFDLELALRLAREILDQLISRHNRIK